MNRHNSNSSYQKMTSDFNTSSVTIIIITIISVTTRQQMIAFYNRLDSCRYGRKYGYTDDRVSI